jgi:AcrR family transcriptional regulator
MMFAYQFPFCCVSRLLNFLPSLDQDHRLAYGKCNRGPYGEKYCLLKTDLIIAAPIGWGDHLVTAKKSARKKQLGKEDWIRVAKTILIKHGIAEVKIEKIAAKLKVTIGSFYWHFSGRPELHEAIIADWLATNTKPLEEAVAHAGDDPRQQYLAFFGVWVLERNFDPAYDSAVRNWARTSSQIAAIISKVEANRIEILCGIMKRFGFPNDEAMMRARVTYYHQVGYYALNIHEPTSARVTLAPDYAKILVGTDWMRPLAGTNLIERAMKGENVSFGSAYVKLPVP